MNSSSTINIDDESDLLNLFNEVFQQNGYKTTAYTDPILALKDSMKRDYDLILSDIRMPQLSGIELAMNIRKKDKDVPILLMTAYDNIDIKPSTLDFLKITEIITKPIKLDDLMEKINKYNNRIKRRKN